MDRESDREDMESKDQDGNADESEEDSSDVDRQTSSFMRKLSSEIERQRREVDEGSAIEIATEEIRRMYESANPSSGHHHIPPAHRPLSCNSSGNTPLANFPPFNPHLANERLFQFSLGNFLQQTGNQGSYPQYSLPGLQASLLQPAGASFHTVPSSRLSSPHMPYASQQRTSPPHSYGRSPPNFQSPPPAHIRRSASVSSRQSREESASPVVQNSWSFEEQFKQLYDIDRDDPKRKEFLDDLFSFMQKHETPVTRLPIMAKSVLDLYELYKLVVQRGGLVDVINKKLWQEVIKGLNLPSSITSAAFTLRTQYMKFLYRYECAKLSLSNMGELQAAIEGNKREGRRTSYPYGDIGQMHSPNHHSHSNGPNTVNNNGGNNTGHHSHMIGQALAHQHHGQSQISPVSLVSTSASSVNSTRPHINGHSSFASSSNNHNSGGTVSSIPNAHGMPPIVLQGAPVPISPEARILEEYIKLISSRRIPPINGTGNSELGETANLGGLDVTQLAFWNLYNGVVKPPLQPNPLTSFQGIATSAASHSQNSEVPLDLGKRRADNMHSANSILPLPKKEALDNQNEHEEEDVDNESVVSDSDSNDDPEKNSSQSPVNSENTSNPVVVRMKINGIYYKGVLHPTRRVRLSQM